MTAGIVRSTAPVIFGMEELPLYRAHTVRAGVTKDYVAVFMVAAVELWTGPVIWTDIGVGHVVRASSGPGRRGRGFEFTGG